MSAIQRVMDALEAAGSRRQGRDWQCPSHEDSRASLSVSEGRDGRVVLFCHGGCTTEVIVTKLGLNMKNLFEKLAAGAGGAARSRPTTNSRGPEIARYTYTDEHGSALFDVVRTKGKRFHQERVEADGRRVGGTGCMKAVRRVLYCLPEVAQAVSAAHTIYVVEGEKDVEAIRRAGAVATCNPGGAGKWKPEFSHYLEGGAVIIWQDRDKAGVKHVRQVAESLKGIAASVRIVEARKGKDAADHLASGLGLDQVVVVENEDREESALPLADLLDLLVECLRRYVAFPNWCHAPAMALWISHTYVFDQFRTTPYLTITSPEKRSGKTTLLELLSMLTREPWLSILPSEAVTFRRIQRDQPTLLLDETDAIWSRFGMKEHEGLRAILNAGYRNGATVARCVGPNLDLRDFSVFSPKALAGIGNLPDTIADRSIPIRLHRRMPSETVERFRTRQVERATEPLRAALELWTASPDLQGLGEAEPSIPEALHDRAQDCWEPLLAIADAAGTRWPELAREIAVELHGTPEAQEETLGILLLRDVRFIFASRGDPESLFTRDLLEPLRMMEESPWADLDGRPLAAIRLARLLGGYGVRPGTVWNPDHTRSAKGYRRSPLETAWSRYLPPPSSPEGGENVTPSHPSESEGLDTAQVVKPEPQAVTADPLGAHASRENLSDSDGCDGVTARPRSQKDDGELEPELIGEPCTRCGTPFFIGETIVLNGGPHHEACSPIGEAAAS